MKKILDMVPATIKNLMIFVFGIILLLHTLGFFTEGLEKTIIIIAIIMIVYGFIELDGPSKLMGLFSSSSKSDKSHDDDEIDRF